MAGYTNSHPELLGWFHPSQIIGQTDSMRAWHRYIRKREEIVTGRSLHASDFKITSGKYNEREDLDQIIRNEYGDNYRLADWNDILTFSKNIEEWADSLGLVEGEENSLLISNYGYRIWLSRQYYISRFNHKKPKSVLAHDSMDDDLDLSDLDDIDEVSTKLDLAKAYLDMGDADGTRSILDEVMSEGNDDQKREADDLLRQLG